MFGNLVIVLCVVVIIFIEFIIFNSERRKTKLYSIIGLALIVFAVVCLILPNIGWILNPFTKKTQVKIVDVETKKPLPDMNVIIVWNIRWAFFPGVVKPKQDKYVYTKTDKNGIFVIESRLKPLSFIVFPLFGRSDIDTYLVMFGHNYRIIESYSVPESEESIIIEAHQINTSEECIDNSRNIQMHYDLVKSDKERDVDKIMKKFLTESYELCEKKYGKR